MNCFGNCSLVRLLGPGLSAVLLTAGPAVAQRDTTIFRVGEIVVQAARPVTTTGGASALEVRLDSLVLPPASTLDRVLRQLPMVHVRTNSRGETEIAVRGSESRQVAVLVDGVPLTLSWDGRTDVSVVPATAARQISLVRGLSSVLYGPNVLGGVIELGIGHTGDVAAREAELSAGLDATGGYAGAASVTVPVAVESGRLLLRAGAGFRDSPGLPLARGIVEPVATRDGLRLNTDVRHVDGFVSARRDFAAGSWLSVAASGFSARRGIAAELDAVEPRLWRYPVVARALAVASVGSPEGPSPLGGRGDVEASVGVDVGRTEIDQYATRAYDRIVAQELGDDRTLTMRLRADNTVGPNGALHLAGTIADVRHEESLEPGGTATYRQRLWSAASELAWRWDAPGAGIDALRVSAGLAADGADTPESGDKPALGALADWGGRIGMTAALGQGQLLVHAGVSRRARFPALRELYSGSLGRFEPNPDLEAERLRAAEAGITTKITGGELQVVAFHHVLSDAIVRVRTPAGRFQRVNRNRITSYGLELLGGVRAGPLSLMAELTVQDVTLDDPASPGARAENQPELFGSAQVRAVLPAALQAGVSVRYTGQQSCLDPQSGDLRTLDAGGHVDAELTREWHVGSGWFSRLAAGVAVENAADAASYDTCGLPQPGRLARIQVRLY